MKKKGEVGERREEKRRKGGVMEKICEDRNYIGGLRISLLNCIMQYLVGEVHEML